MRANRKAMNRPSDTSEKRLAEALRANLKRRKAQARAMAPEKPEKTEKGD